MGFLKWLKKTLLPFEEPDHPLYTPPHEEPDLSDWDDLGPYPQRDDRIGPNYARKPFSKPQQYQRWGSKWYKKS